MRGQQLIYRYGRKSRVGRWACVPFRSCGTVLQKVTRELMAWRFAAMAFQELL